MITVPRRTEEDCHSLRPQIIQLTQRFPWRPCWALAGLLFTAGAWQGRAGVPTAPPAPGTLLPARRSTSGRGVQATAKLEQTPGEEGLAQAVFKSRARCQAKSREGPERALPWGHAAVAAWPCRTRGFAWNLFGEKNQIHQKILSVFTSGRPHL